jgi:hypothetical protein
MVVARVVLLVNGVVNDGRLHKFGLCESARARSNEGRNDEVGTRNDEPENRRQKSESGTQNKTLAHLHSDFRILISAFRFYFIVHRSYFRVFLSVRLPCAAVVKLFPGEATEGLKWRKIRVIFEPCRPSLYGIRFALDKAVMRLSRRRFQAGLIIWRHLT